MNASAILHASCDVSTSGKLHVFSGGEIIFQMDTINISARPK
jgi:hypothetical protein